MQHYHMTKKIISVSGLIGSGKDTVANYLTTHHGFKKLAFASSLKDAVSVVFNWDREMLEGATKNSREWRDQIDPWWSKRLDIPHLTPRWVLQHWGTEVLRQGFHDDIWIASLESKLINITDNVVITDARFFNELDVVKKLGGTSVRVVRGPNPDWYQAAELYNTCVSDEFTNEMYRIPAGIVLDRFKVHASEYSSVGYTYDHILENNATIDDLNTKISEIL